MVGGKCGSVGHGRRTDDREEQRKCGEGKQERLLTKSYSSREGKGAPCQEKMC